MRKFDIIKVVYKYFECENNLEINLNTKGETLKSLMNKEYIEYDLWKKLFNLQNADANIF